MRTAPDSHACAQGFVAARPAAPQVIRRLKRGVESRGGGKSSEARWSEHLCGLPGVSKPSALIYVDGFNLYRRCLEGHPDSKWLDLHALATRLLPDHNVAHVHYFTANLRTGLLADPQTPVRQQAYLRALRTMPTKVSVHLGHFRNDVRWMPSQPQTIDPRTGDFQRVRVRKLEEKGTDVNLAIRMVADAAAHRADLYALLSNDSDQVGTLRMLKDELRVRTGIIFPMASAKSAKDLVSTTPDVRVHVSAEALLASQLPDELKDSNGTVRRPATWTAAESPKAPESGAF